MKNFKSLIIAIAVILILLFSVFQLTKKVIKLDSENTINLTNFKASQTLGKYYKTKYNQTALLNDIYLLDIKEVKKTLPQILTEIQNLKVKPGRAVVYTQSGINTQTNIITKLKDSVILDTVHIYPFDVSDGYLSLSGAIINDTLKGNVTYQDTITQVVFRGERYKPQYWIFSKRKLQQTIALKYPNSKIIYNQTIKIQ